MRLEPLAAEDEKARPLGEQIREASLEVNLAARLLVALTEILPVPAAVHTSTAVSQALSGVAERLAALAALAERKAARPVVVKPATPARPPKRPAAARPAAASQKANGATKPAPAAPAAAAQPPLP